MPQIPPAPVVGTIVVNRWYNSQLGIITDVDFSRPDYEQIEVRWQDGKVSRHALDYLFDEGAFMVRESQKVNNLGVRHAKTIAKLRRAADQS